MTTELDRIEREIDIAAPAARVWGLISEPGWYINDGAIAVSRVQGGGDRGDDALNTVHDSVHGSFTFRTVMLDEPRYAAFRWLADFEDPDGPSTLVEFWIEETGANSVLLRVAESGFASLPGDAAERRKRYDGNAEGWTFELDLAKKLLEGAEVAS